jgi:hypothetical protein
MAKLKLVSDIIIEELERRFSETAVGDIELLGITMDPCLKDLPFLGTSVVTRAKELLRQKYQSMKDTIVHVEDTSVNVQSEEKNNLPTTKRLRVALALEYKEELAKLVSPAHVERNEVDDYYSIPPAAEGEDPLQWWHEKQQKLPTLARMARIYLSPQPTSATIERCFSTAGQVAPNMLPVHVEMLLVCHKNFDILRK